jgi:enoyl-CoA hydratase/carnithine racemase
VTDKPDVLVDIDDHVAWVTINHPERRNAFDFKTQVKLTETFRELGSDHTIGAIVLSGEGDKAFSAGGYLGSLSSSNTDELRELFFATIEVVNAIRRARQPVIAAVNGVAVGGGNELVIACDFAIAAETATFGQVGPRIGSAPVIGGTNMLTLQVGEKRAKEISFLCRRYSAAEAKELGWINEIVPAENLLARVREWCDEIMQLSPRYLEAAKHSSNYWWDLLQPGYVQGAALLWASAGSDEQREGLAAFQEKRPADFMKFRGE